jgi:hypothetical protein
MLNDLPKYFIRQSSTYYIGTNREIIISERKKKNEES